MKGPARKTIDEPEATGPRGGRTTRSPSGMVKKNFWISLEEAEALRAKAYEDHSSEAEILRLGLRLALGLEEQ